MTELAALTAVDGTPFGHALKEKYFMLDKEYCNLNHGSYGTVPIPVFERQQKYYMEQESRPDAWFRENYFSYVKEARSTLAELVGTHVNNLVLVENASNAVNSVLRSIGLQRGDKVLRLSTAYGMVCETLDWLVHAAGIEVIVADIDFPVDGPDQILDSVRHGLRLAEEDGSDGVKLCIFSHITSMPAIVLPIKEMTQVSQSKGALVMIDGAHAPGQIDVDVDRIGAEFYIGNCHKWLYAPKGTAFLTVSPAQQLQHSPAPAVISGSGQRDFVGRFAYTGTRDYMPLACLPAAIQFRHLILGGDAKVQRYCHELAVAGGVYLARAWGTRLLAPTDMIGFMVNVELPSTNAEAIAYMRDLLESKFNIYIVYDKVIEKDNGKESCSSSRFLYHTRLSGQVYLEIGDFIQIEKLVPQLLAEYEKSKIIC